MQWHQLDHMQTICTSLQSDNHTNTPSLNCYEPDALLDAQPTLECQFQSTSRMCSYTLKKLKISALFGEYITTSSGWRGYQI